MSALPIREKIAAELDNLSEEQAIIVLEFIQSVKDDHAIVRDGDEENDPLVGFISGPTDMAERSKAILRTELGLPKSKNDWKE